MEERHVTWRKASRSTSNGGSCVEVAELNDDDMGVRDSKLGARSPILRVTREEFRGFIEGLK